MKDDFTDIVINRLTLYHCILSEYEEKGLEFISSPQFAERLKIDNSQVRKDIKLLGNTGKCKVGYMVKDLKETIERSLGFQTNKDAFIIGAGNLGCALAKYDNFHNYGLNVLALFDNDPLKVNMTVNGKEIFHISNLKDLKERLNIEIAILTVPKQAAQECADLLTLVGIKYIWNFTPRVLKTPEGVQVRNENLIGNFLRFTAKNGVKS